MLEMKRYLRLEVIVRAVADVVLLNLSVVCGLVARAILIGPAEFSGPAATETFSRLSVFLSLVGPSIFASMGFYTKGRYYASRYKALIIFQATALLFVGLGFTNYLLGNERTSRLVVVVTWFVATLLLEAARFWTWVWELVITSESKSLVRQTTRKEKETVLLIGGAGYIGSSLLPRLLLAGYRVRLLDAFIYGDDSIAHCKGHPGLEIMKADLRNVHDVVYAMRDVESVVHLGAIVGDPACSLDEDLTIEVNLIATRTIAEVAKANGVSKLIFASTCSVYGSSDLILDERSILNPVSLYARSKIACERVLLKLSDTAFCPVILRFGTVYGLSGRTRFDLVVNLLVAKALAEGKITVIGRDQWRPFLHVHDAARATLAALGATRDQLSESIFNVGSDEQNYTLAEVGERIKHAVPTATLTYFDSPEDRRNYRVSFSRIRKLLRFSPEWTLDAGIQQVASSIISGRVIDYRLPIYSNVKFLTEHNGTLLKSQSGWIKEVLDVNREPMAKIA
jgi:nucleoside-diphosphate-sugar epimerase